MPQALLCLQWPQQQGGPCPAVEEEVRTATSAHTSTQYISLGFYYPSVKIFRNHFSTAIKKMGISVTDEEVGLTHLPRVATFTTLSRPIPRTIADFCTE